MAEYIDREALIKYAEKQRVVIKDGTSVAEAMRIQGKVFRKCVETVPTADVVEVVRCKDCKYWQDNNGGYPHKECRWGQDETPNADDFCSYGERKNYEDK